MNRLFPEKMLHRPISELDLSEKFKRLAEKHGFHSLADILKLDKPKNLLNYEGFDMVLIMEFTNFLSANGMRKYLMT